MQEISKKENSQRESVERYPPTRRIISMPQDGSCLYHSLAYQLSNIRSKFPENFPHLSDPKDLEHNAIMHSIIELESNLQTIDMISVNEHLKNLEIEYNKAQIIANFYRQQICDYLLDYYNPDDKINDDAFISKWFKTKYYSHEYRESLKTLRKETLEPYNERKKNFKPIADRITNIVITDEDVVPDSAIIKEKLKDLFDEEKELEIKNFIIYFISEIMPTITQDIQFADASNTFQKQLNYQINTDDRVEIRSIYNFNDYIKSIRTGGWGGVIELTAITQLYGIPVIVLNNDNSETRHDPPETIGINLGELRFRYTGNHYNVFVEEPESLTTLQPEPSQSGGRSKKSKRSKNKKTSRKNIKTSKKKNSKMKKYKK